MLCSQNVQLPTILHLDHGQIPNRMFVLQRGYIKIGKRNDENMVFASREMFGLCVASYTDVNVPTVDAERCGRTRLVSCLDLASPTIYAAMTTDLSLPVPIRNTNYRRVRPPAPVGRVHLSRLRFGHCKMC